jgi:hypothetical protein
MTDILLDRSATALLVSPRWPGGAMRDGSLDQGFRCAPPLATFSRPVGAKSCRALERQAA